MLRTRMIAASFLAVLGLAGIAAMGFADDKKDEGWIALFNGTDLSGWQPFLDPKSKATPEQIWSVKDGMIRCDGSVFGYLITDKEYSDYLLHVEWRWGEKITKSRNSGVFVHVTGPDKIWPKGVEAQLFSGRAGDIWLVDKFKLKVDPARQDPKQTRHFVHIKDGVEKPIGEWNEYDITCKGDSIKLVVNGVEENEGTEAEMNKGKILLQSEGAEIYFRNVKLKHLR